MKFGSEVRSYEGLGDCSGIDAIEDICGLTVILDFTRFCIIRGGGGPPFSDCAHSDWGKKRVRTRPLSSRIEV